MCSCCHAALLVCSLSSPPGLETSPHLQFCPRFRLRRAPKTHVLLLLQSVIVSESFSEDVSPVVPDISVSRIALFGNTQATFLQGEVAGIDLAFGGNFLVRVFFVFFRCFVLFYLDFFLPAAVEEPRVPTIEGTLSASC